MEERGLELRIWDLPEICISHIFSLTSPRDACRCSAVSSKFRMAAESDAAWERFLPSNWEGTISRSVSPVEFSSLKALYFHLCDSPILLDQGKRSFALEKISGKISYMLGPEDLWVQWHCVPLVWDGNYPMPYAFPYHKPIKSRFSEICHINDIDRLQLRGRIQMKLLSPNTTYAAYLVYVPRFAGIECPPLKVSVGFVGEGVESEVDEVGTNAYLLTTIFTPEDDGYRYRDRSDEWMEIKMGEFFTGQDDVHEVEMRLWEIGEYDVFQASGLDVQGIEIRLKRGQNE